MEEKPLHLMRGQTMEGPNAQSDERMILEEIDVRNLSADARDLCLSQAERRDHNKNEDPYAIEEIEIEEMAIDGICGVY